MLGLPLAYEMALVAALICLVSWLMGRTLCKSKEHEERAAKQSLQTANTHLESQLTERDRELRQLHDRLRLEQQTMSELQHQHKTLIGQFDKLQQDYQASLNTLQELQAYRTQFETLGKVHEERARQVIHWQEALQQQRRETQQTLALAEQKHAELQALIQALHTDQQADAKRIGELQDILATHEQKQQILISEADNQDALIARLRQENAALQETSRQQHDAIDALNAKLAGHLQSVNANNQRISTLLETL